MNDESKTGEQASRNPSAGEAVRAGRLWILKAVLLSLVLLILAPFVVPTVERVAAGLRYPYQMDSEEGFVLYQAWRLRHGQAIFRKLDEPPYVAATYAPVYLLVSAATLWGRQPSFFGGRLIAALSVAAICLFMGLIVWRETRSVLAVLLAPLLFLNSYDVYQWLPYYRVDFTALSIGLAGLWLLGAPGEISKARLRGACACFVIMVYTKQVELAPFVAAVVYFLISDRRLAWRLFRNVAAWGIGIAAVLTLATRGQFLVHNVLYNANPFDWVQLQITVVGRTLEDGRRIGGHLILFNRFFVFAALVCLIWYAFEKLRPRSEWIQGPTDPAKEPPETAEAKKIETDSPAATDRVEEKAWGRLGLFVAYAIVASIGILGLGKIGAATNYLIEPKAAWSLFFALVLGKTLRPLGETRRVFGLRPVFFPVAVVLLLHAVEFLCSSTLVPAVQPLLRRNPNGAVAAFFEQDTVNDYLTDRPQVLYARDNMNPTKADRVNGNEIVRMLRDVDGPVFCEHAIFPLLAGHDVYIQPFIMKELSQETRWDQTPVVEALEEGRFPLLQATEDVFEEGFKFHYTDAMTTAIRTAYKTQVVFAGSRQYPAVYTHYLLRPRDRETTR